MLLGGTVVMPVNPTDGQRVSISSTQTITTLTVNANAGQTISGGGSLSISMTSALEWRYVLSLTLWVRA
jgi:hypothetical protein